MKEAGVDSIVANYIAWGKGGLESAINGKAKIDSKMGSKKEFAALIKYAKENGVALSFDTNLNDIYKSGLFNYHRSSYATRSIDKSYTGVTDTLDIAYVRGSLIWISFLIAGIYGVYFFISQMIRVRKFSRFNAFVLLMIGLLMLIGMAGQILFSIPLMWPSISTCIVLYYLHSCGMKFDTDLFTNVDNRNTFERRMIEFEKYKEVWVIVCDVNELKYINDTFGHRKGDELLSVTASLLAKLFSNYGAVSRIGGDEFCILCPTKQSKNQINTLMTKVNMGIKNKIKEVRVNYPLSYGFARYRKSDNDKRLIDVFEDADLMMFEMKKKIK
jgi:diguanylate cyclase (GGDEF)-like protein